MATRQSTPFTTDSRRDQIQAAEARRHFLTQEAKLPDLVLIASTGTIEDRRLIALNPAANETIKLRLVAMEDPQINRIFSDDLTCSGAVLEAICANGTALCISRCASHPNTPQTTLERLASHPSPSVRIPIWNNPRTPQVAIEWAQDQLAVSMDRFDIAFVARHARFASGQALLARLAQTSTDMGVLASLLANPAMTEALIRAVHDRFKAVMFNAHTTYGPLLQAFAFAPGVPEDIRAPVADYFIERQRLADGTKPAAG